MEVEDHLLAPQIKWMIIHYKLQGESNKATARIVGERYQRPSLSHQTVKAIWAKYQRTKGVENEWNWNGRPFVLKGEDFEEVIEFFQGEPKKISQ